MAIRIPGGAVTSAPKKNKPRHAVGAAPGASAKQSRRKFSSAATGHTDDRQARSFEQDALGFLIGYARRSKGRAFSAEAVTLAAQKANLAPLDLRAWGPVFTQAAKDGYIRRSGTVFPRTMGNGSLAPGWEVC